MNSQTVTSQLTQSNKMRSEYERKLSLPPANKHVHFEKSAQQTLNEMKQMRLQKYMPLYQKIAKEEDSDKPQPRPILKKPEDFLSSLSKPEPISSNPIETLKNNIRIAETNKTEANNRSSSIERSQLEDSFNKSISAKKNIQNSIGNLTLGSKSQIVSINREEIKEAKLATPSVYQEVKVIPPETQEIKSNAAPLAQLGTHEQNKSQSLNTSLPPQKQTIESYSSLNSNNDDHSSLAYSKASNETRNNYIKDQPIKNGEGTIDRKAFELSFSKEDPSIINPQSSKEESKLTNQSGKEDDKTKMNSPKIKEEKKSENEKEKEKENKKESSRYQQQDNNESLSLKKGTINKEANEAIKQTNADKVIENAVENNSGNISNEKVRQSNENATNNAAETNKKEEKEIIEKTKLLQVFNRMQHFSDKYQMYIAIELWHNSINDMKEYYLQKARRKDKAIQFKSIMDFQKTKTIFCEFAKFANSQASWLRRVRSAFLLKKQVQYFECWKLYTLLSSYEKVKDARTKKKVLGCLKAYVPSPDLDSIVEEKRILLFKRRILKHLAKNANFRRKEKAITSLLQMHMKRKAIAFLKKSKQAQPATKQIVAAKSKETSNKDGYINIKIIERSGIYAQKRDDNTISLQKKENVSINYKI